MVAAICADGVAESFGAVAAFRPLNLKAGECVDHGSPGATMRS
jgi:hypothetical protein